MPRIDLYQPYPLSTHDNHHLRSWEGEIHGSPTKILPNGEHEPPEMQQGRA